MPMLRNVTWLSAAHLLVKPLWFLYLTYGCVQALGMAQYGVFNAAVALTGFLSILCDLGTTELTTRTVAHSPAQAPALFADGLMMRLGLAGLVLLLSLALGAGLGHRGSDLLAVLAAAAFSIGLRLNEFCRAFYRAAERMQEEAVSVVTERALVIAAGLLVLWRRPSVPAVLGAMALAMLVSWAGNALWVHRRHAALRWRTLSWRRSARLLRVSGWIGLYALTSLVFFSAGSVLVEALAGAAEGGAYSLSSRVVEMLQLLPAIVSASLLPRLTRLLAERNPDRLRNTLRTTVRLTGGLALLGAVVLTMTAPYATDVLAGGAEGARAGMLLRLTAWAFPLVTLCALFNTALLAFAEIRFLALWQAGCALATLLLNLLLIPRFASFGAVWALLIGLSAVLAGSIWRVRHLDLRLNPISA
jgi:O-antigen/teichoic acid export membrane protein